MSRGTGRIPLAPTLLITPMTGPEGGGEEYSILVARKEGLFAGLPIYEDRLQQ